MKKILALIAVGVFLAGCVSNAPKSAAEAPESGKYSFAELQDGIRPMSLKGGVVESDACKNGNGAMCENFADSMYSKRDYPSAANAYNAACVGSHIFPSCMKLASMFEKGEGVEQNKFNAIDLYRITCYYGYKNACKEMRRLGYNG